MNGSLPLNLRLAAWLAFKSLGRNRMTTIATILGVAIGMTVVGSILILDANSAHTPQQKERLAKEIARRQLENQFEDRRVRARFKALSLDSPEVQQQLEKHENYMQNPNGRAKQPQIDGFDFIRKGDEGAGTRAKKAATGDKSAAAAGGVKKVVGDKSRETVIRLAVRVSSIMAFFIGAVIVFYTMRFSLTKRGREFALLRCLGESRDNVSLTLLVETLILGVVGTLLGLAFSFALSYKLMRWGISTTGLTPLQGYAVPWLELSALSLFSLMLAVLGVAGPVWSQYRVGIPDMLQPGFLARQAITDIPRLHEFGWMIPPLFGVSYLAMRPFLYSSLSVIQFFVTEVLVILALVFLTLVLVRPLIWQLMKIGEGISKPLFPLETMLTGHRLRVNSSKMLFSIAGVILVFSLLLALYSIIHALQKELYGWIDRASAPYGYYKIQRGVENDQQAAFAARLKQQGIAFFRLSQRLRGKVPIRVIDADALNPWLKSRGKPQLAPGEVIFSSYLAARFQVDVGDVLRFKSEGENHLFTIIAIDDSVGYFPAKSAYMDLKQYAIVSSGNPLFADNIDLSLGQLAVARNFAAGEHPKPLHRDGVRRLLPQPEYKFTVTGDYLNFLPWEIRKDLLIFDFILYMTVLMACMGVANTMLIQVYGRRRELAILKTIGIARRTVAQLVMVEGFMVGLVSAAFVMVLGNAIGAVGVHFLDRFTKAGYAFELTPGPQIGITVLIMICCALAAVYPALAATRISSAESLHYE